MKPADDLERRIARISETTGPDMDERMIGEIRAAFTGSVARSLSGPIKRVAAAAAVVMVISLAVTLLSKKPEPSQDPRAVLSVGEMLTVKHLNVTSREGGMQALATLCEETAERVDLKPKELTVNRLLAELNGI